MKTGGREMQKNKLFNNLISILSVLFILAAFLFFLIDELAFAFLGAHPIEMSYRRAVVIDPENAAHFYGMGVFRDKIAANAKDPIHQKQRYHEGLLAMEKAIELNPYHLMYRVGYGDLALKAGYYQEGEEAFEQESFPFDFEFLFARAFFYFKCAARASHGDREILIEKGLLSYNRAVEIQPKFVRQIMASRLSTLPEEIQTVLKMKIS